jgi:hypothetical protein
VENEIKVKKGKNIAAIYFCSHRDKSSNRPIKSDILKAIKDNNCVVCGSNSEIVCDHKNDLYNDQNVLSIDTQKITDFQPLCNHCNLVKRQICKKEKETHKIYSAKNIAIFSNYQFNFPWEMKALDINDSNCKLDTYWYDPVEFVKKCVQYSIYWDKFKYVIRDINKLQLYN